MAHFFSGDFTGISLRDRHGRRPAGPYGPRLRPPTPCGRRSDLPEACRGSHFGLPRQSFGSSSVGPQPTTLPLIDLRSIRQTRIHASHTAYAGYAFSGAFGPPILVVSRGKWTRLSCAKARCCPCASAGPYLRPVCGAAAPSAAGPARGPGPADRLKSRFGEVSSRES